MMTLRRRGKSPEAEQLSMFGIFSEVSYQSSCLLPYYVRLVCGIREEKMRPEKSRKKEEETRKLSTSKEKKEKIEEAFVLVRR